MTSKDSKAHQQVVDPRATTSQDQHGEQARAAWIHLKNTKNRNAKAHDEVTLQSTKLQQEADAAGAPMHNSNTIINTITHSYTVIDL